MHKNVILKYITEGNKLDVSLTIAPTSCSDGRYQTFGKRREASIGRPIKGTTDKYFANVNGSTPVFLPQDTDNLASFYSSHKNSHWHPSFYKTPSFCSKKGQSIIDTEKPS